MEQRPILFSGPMVRAILEGQKTVTRRVVKPQYLEGPWSVRPATDPRHERHSHDWWLPTGSQPYAALPPCPYGKPGDILWVREAWAQINVAQAPGESWVVYRECDNRTDYGGPWKPSIHMRRRDCRIILEVTDVRVERLQDITEEQALAEGIDQHQLADSQDRYDMVADHNMTGRPTAAGEFAHLWASINGAKSWYENPWVWVVEFKRVRP
ncbi:hypothetical protein IRZ59_21785 [Pseudomonas guariconensis]|uniref:hypothetical protein n=1 Tax=Pseudomonas guariconensis TaxID=1288410 RepID=UPI0018ABBCC1|nr:hypothetical protein [Pseudomonas guariconensis]MBF8733064.1 hypothetical protein [Pseudomonas guariconensis]